MHSIRAVPRISRCTHFVRRPPHGGRRMECTNRELRGAAAVECIPERIYEQLSHESCSEMRREA
eukprot:3369691-Lingulodinium_polyedra.AAC.1